MKTLLRGSLPNYLRCCKSPIWAVCLRVIPIPFLIFILVQLIIFLLDSFCNLELLGLCSDVQIKLKGLNISRDSFKCFPKAESSSFVIFSRSNKDDLAIKFNIISLCLLVSLTKVTLCIKDITSLMLIFYYWRCELKPKLEKSKIFLFTKDKTFGLKLNFSDSITKSSLKEDWGKGISFVR